MQRRWMELSSIRGEMDEDEEKQVAAGERENMVDHEDGVLLGKDIAENQSAVGEVAAMGAAVDAGAKKGMLVSQWTIQRLTTPPLVWQMAETIATIPTRVVGGVSSHVTSAPMLASTEIGNDTEASPWPIYWHTPPPALRQRIEAEYERVHARTSTKSPVWGLRWPRDASTKKLCHQKKDTAEAS